MVDDIADPAAPGPAAEVLALLRGRGQSLATAESLTGGLLSGAITAVPGSSEVYAGGLVTYATRLKIELLGVPETLVASRGVVSAACAEAMALGAAARCGADWALATTGVAGPGPQDDHPAGTVFVGLRRPDGSATAQLLQLAGGREVVRAATVEAALQLLRGVLLSANSGGTTGGSHPGR